MTCIDTLHRPDSASSRGVETRRTAGWAALRDWAENVGILARYALGLDLYDRGEGETPARRRPCPGISF